MKTKLEMLTILMLLPLSLFSQSFYDDIYNPTATRTVKQASQMQQPTQTIQNSTNSNQEYQIETNNVGNQQAVIVRNAAGDTVYYSGDYANANGNTNGTSIDTLSLNGINGSHIQQSNQPSLLLQLSDGYTTTTYPVNNINWNINTFGGYPYYNSWMQPYFYNSYYPYGYYSPFSFYGGLNPWLYGGLFDDFYGDYWDMGWGFGWNSPYYYGGWGGYPYYYGNIYNNWVYSRPIPYNYTENSRRNARTSINNGIQPYSYSSGSRAMVGRGSVGSPTQGARAVNSSIGTRQMTAQTVNQFTQVNGRQNNNISAQNPINVRGTQQNRAFWTNFLTRNGYNVTTPANRNVQYQPRNNGNYVQQNNVGGSRRVVVISPQGNEVQNVQRNSTYRVQRSTPVYEQPQRVERPVYNETRTYNYSPSYNNGGGGRSESYGGGGGDRGGRR